MSKKGKRMRGILSLFPEARMASKEEVHFTGSFGSRHWLYGRSSEAGASFSHP